MAPLGAAFLGSGRPWNEFSPIIQLTREDGFDLVEQTIEHNSMGFQKAMDVDQGRLEAVGDVFIDEQKCAFRRSVQQQRLRTHPPHITLAILANFSVNPLDPLHQTAAEPGYQIEALSLPGAFQEADDIGLQFLQLGVNQAAEKANVVDHQLQERLAPARVEVIVKVFVDRTERWHPEQGLSAGPQGRALAA